MAVGLGLLFGFVLVRNFDAPYRADSVTDFWRRWHISLSTWLRDYLYIPLGGNRLGPARTYLNLLVVMLLGGFWHGASWNFLLWGALHGSLLAGERVLGKDSPYRRLPHAARVGLTFLVVSLGWVLFRADTLGGARDYYLSLVGLGPGSSGMGLLAGVLYTPYHLATLAIAAIVVWAAPPVWSYTGRLTLARAGLCLALLAVSVLFLWTQTENPFLYFQF